MNGARPDMRRNVNHGTGAGSRFHIAAPMHAALRTLPLVALGLCSFSSLRSQTTELPAIFAPKVSAERARMPARAPARVGTSPVSERVRSLISAASARVLDNAVVFNMPTTTPDVVVDEASGAMVMAPVVVRGQSLQDSQVRPPTPRLFQFNPLGADQHRGVVGGVTMPLYHTFIGQKELQVDFNVVNGAGRGVDHGRDFTRAEIWFSLKW